MSSIDNLMGVLAPVINEIPVLVKIEKFLQDNSWITTETVDDVKLAVDVLSGNSSAIAPDIQAALSAAPIPAPWNALVASPTVADAVAAQVVSAMRQRHTAAVAPTEPPAPGAEIAHIGQDTAGQVVSG